MRNCKDITLSIKDSDHTNEVEEARALDLSMIEEGALVEIDSIASTIRSEAPEGVGTSGKALRALSIPALLYAFVIGLKLVGAGAKVAGGRDSAQFFDVVNNPVAAIAIGELVTVALQSSSTATSIIIGLVGAGELDTKLATYMVFGANIGTTMTNNLIALFWLKRGAGQASNFARGFATSCMHDIFNMCSLALAVTLQASCNFYPIVTKGLTIGITDDGAADEVDFFDALTADVMEQIIVPDKDTIKRIAGDARYADCSSLTTLAGGLLKDIGLSETKAGVTSIIGGVLVLSACLFTLTRVLRQLLQGAALEKFQQLLSMNPYLNMLLGCSLTILMQSSSVVTSVLTTLNMGGHINREQMFPLQIGANWGTTVTGLLAAASAVSERRYAMRVALAHMLFNIMGTAVYPIKRVREQLILKPAAFIERKVSAHVSSAFAYLAMLYFIIPGAILAISLATDKEKDMGDTVGRSNATLFGSNASNLTLDSSNINNTYAEEVFACP